MRAQEFITERDGTIGKRRQAATVGLNVFGDSERQNSDYTLNRVMMAAAMADGSGAPIDMDAKSWVGKKSTASPYTKIEQEMLKLEMLLKRRPKMLNLEKLHQQLNQLLLFLNIKILFFIILNNLSLRKLRVKF